MRKKIIQYVPFPLRLAVAPIRPECLGLFPIAQMLPRAFFPLALLPRSNDFHEHLFCSGQYPQYRQLFLFRSSWSNLLILQYFFWRALSFSYRIENKLCKKHGFPPLRE